MRRWLMVPVGFALVGSILFAFSSRRAPERARPAVTNDRVSADIESLKRELSQLKAEPKMYVMTAPKENAVPAVESETKAAAPPADKAELTPQQRLDQTAADLDVRMAKEPADAAWGRQATAEIRDAVARGLPSARILETECATSMCRVLLAHDSPEDQKGVGTALPSLAPFRHGVFFHQDLDSAPPKTSLYVVREGYSFREEEE